MSDFEKHQPGLESPASRAVAVTPDDATDLAHPARALRFGGAGDVTLVTVGGDEITLPVQASETLPIRVARVKATGTTATGIVALW